MRLPLEPPLSPMLARLARTLPTGALAYEPKWDGFRCLVFHDEGELLLQSRSGRPLDRYFPELVAALPELLPERCVLDGELVVAVGGALDFDALSNRVHPAASRVARLAEAMPASVVAFDLLAEGDASLLEVPFGDRRARLEERLAGAAAPVHLTPLTTDPEVAGDWFDRFEGAGLDGVMAKPLDEPYAPGARTLYKVKHRRTADVVVGGFRWHKDGRGVGSLLLGLHDDDGRLRHVGVAASFPATRRVQLLDELAGYRPADGEELDHPWLEGDGTASSPRAASRWTAGRDTSWEPLRPELVAEVAYEQLQGDRFRHGARLLRWRPDRQAASCRFDQLEVVPPRELVEVLAAAGGPPRSDAEPGGGRGR